MDLNSILRTSSFTISGGVLGYGSAVLLPTVTPIAGLIIGASFGLLADKVLSRLNLDNSLQDQLIAVIAMIATAALSFLICHSLFIPITFAACALFPWQMGFCIAVVYAAAQLLIEITRPLHAPFRNIFR